MSEMEKLAAELHQQGKVDSENRAKAVAEFKEWQASLETLFNNIQAWAAPLISSGIATAQPSRARLTESPLGNDSQNYDVPTLTLTVNSKVLSIKAKGFYYMGCHGLVEISGGRQTWQISRHFKDQQESWLVNHVFGQKAAQANEFNADSLAEIIRSFIEKAR